LLSQFPDETEKKAISLWLRKAITALQDVLQIISFSFLLFVGLQYHLPELPQRNSLRIPQGRRDRLLKVMKNNPLDGWS
jgi:hypothetical protein